MRDNSKLRFGLIRPTVGYLYIPDFADLDEAEGFDEVLNQFSETKGLIIDLRRNGGGGSEPGYQMAGRFIENSINCDNDYFIELDTLFTDRDEIIEKAIELLN